MKQAGPFKYAAFTLLIVVYVAVRFSGLTDSCLWFDEIFSIHAAEHDWTSLFSFVALDLIHPPLFYVLLKVWIAIGGEGLFWLRLLPVAFAVVAVFPFVSLCRELKLPFWTQSLALLLFAVNGSLIKYSQELRMYSLLLCLSLFSMWLFTRYFVKGKSYIPLLVVNLFLVHSHYFGWFVVLAEIAAVLIFQREKLRRILLMFAITFVSFVPWILAVSRAAGAGSELGQNIGWVARPGLRAIGELALNLVEPFYYQASSGEPVSIIKVSLPLLLIGVAALVVYFTGRKKEKEDEPSIVKLLILFAAVPLLTVFVMSVLLPYSIWGTRHLIIVFVPVLILVAVAITRLPNAALRTSVLTLILLFCGYGFVLAASREKPKYVWCAWQQLADEWIMSPHYSSEPKTLYVFEDLVGYHFWFSTRYLQSYRVKVVRGLEGTTDDPAYFLPRGFDSVQTLDADGAFSQDNFWIAFRDPDPDYGSPGYLNIPPELYGPMRRRGFMKIDGRTVRVGDETAFIWKMERIPLDLLPTR